MTAYGKSLFIFCFLMLFLNRGSPQEAVPQGSREVKWRMALLIKNGAVYESVPFGNALSMTRRDVYHLFLGFDSESFCYVIQEDDEGKLPFVYRKTVSPGDRITLPGEGRDFIAGELRGTSRLYVIVSTEPRQNLDRLLEQHEQRAAAAAIERSILSEVLAVRKNILSSQEIPEISSPPPEGDPVMKGELYLFEGRDIRVVTVTVRVQ